MNEETIFSKIVKGEVPAEIIYEDEFCMAFNDVNPQAPTHVLIIPKNPIPRLCDAINEDATLLGHMMLKAGEIARMLGVEDSFRVVINNGSGAGQTVFHLHLHLLAGREMSWPPG